MPVCHAEMGRRIVGMTTLAVLIPEPQCGCVLMCLHDLDCVLACSHLCVFI